MLQVVADHCTGFEVRERVFGWFLGLTAVGRFWSRSNNCAPMRVRLSVCVHVYVCA